MFNYTEMRRNRRVGGKRGTRLRNMCYEHPEETDPSFSVFNENEPEKIGGRMPDNAFYE